MSDLLNGSKLWLSCETLTVSNVFNPMSIKWWGEGGDGEDSNKIEEGVVKRLVNFCNVGVRSLFNATRGENFDKIQFDAWLSP